MKTTNRLLCRAFTRKRKHEKSLFETAPARREHRKLRGKIKH